MKKMLFCLLFSTILLTSCTLQDSQSANKGSDSSTLTKEKEVSTDYSKEISPTEKSEKNEGSKTNISPGVSRAKGKVQLYGGSYFDERHFADKGIKNFCEIVISNLTETSFDFTVYEITNSENDNKKAIFLQNTAIFTGDGTKATFYGENYTLNFIFPNNHGTSPVVTDIKISGFEPLEGKTYCNNKIPVQKYYDLIKEAYQVQKDYIDSIEDPKVKQSVQSTLSASNIKAYELLLEYPEDSDAIDGSLRKVLSW